MATPKNNWFFTQFREKLPRLGVGKGEFANSKEDGRAISLKPCPLLLKAPFVCNPCSKRSFGCRKDKQFYFAIHTQENYKTTLSESRKSIALNRQVFYDNDRIISKGVKNGQHLYHILQTHNLGVSKSSVYRYVKKGYLSIAAIDLLRAVMFKPRKQQG